MYSGLGGNAGPPHTLWVEAVLRSDNYTSVNWYGTELCDPRMVGIPQTPVGADTDRGIIWDFAVKRPIGEKNE